MSGNNNLELLPVLDNEVLKKKAQEAAMKGAMETIDKFYTQYDSPFKKAIEEELKKQQPSLFLQLPDILGRINDSLSRQIDEIANTAVAKTYVPLVSKILTRVEKDVKFSEILKEFIQLFEYDEKDISDFSCEIAEEGKYGWLNISISCAGSEFTFTLHKVSVKAGEAQTYSLLNLPGGPGYKDSTSKKMTLHVEGAKLELPFTSDILSNDFMSYCARLIICDSNIYMDVRDFDDWMFPEDECHCH